MSKFGKFTEKQNATKLNNKASEAAGGLGAIWYPPTQPASNQIITASTNPEHYINNMWETLRNAFPNYVSRTTMGKDQSDTYNIYKYVFEPKNPEKTIIIGAQIHGEEYEGQKILFRFLYHVCYDSDKYPQLNYIRNKVRIVVIPVQNPAGIAMQQRNNSRGVDLNRNFTYGWNSATGEPKGDNPLSENESKIIDTVMSQYPNAVAHLDIHNTSPGIANDYYTEVPRYFHNNINLIYQVINAIKPKPDVITNIRTTQLPVTANHASSKYGFNSAIVEWVPGSLSGTPYNSTDITYGLTYIGNVILQYCKLEKPAFLKVKGAKSWSFTNSATAMTTTSTSYTELTQLTVTLNSEAGGILMLNGDFVALATDTTAQCYISPVILQDGNPKIPVTSATSQQSTYEVYNVASGGRGHVGFNQTVPILPTNASYGNIVIKIFWKTTAGTLQHLRSRMSLLFIPTEGMAYEEYSNNGSGVLVKTFPSELT